MLNLMETISLVSLIIPMTLFMTSLIEDHSPYLKEATIIFVLFALLVGYIGIALIVNSTRNKQ